MGSLAAMPESRPVVVAVDGARTAPVTVDLAVANAVRHHAPLVIVHVWPGRYQGSFRSRSTVPAPADGQRLLDIAARRARIAAPGLPISTELLDGAAAGALAARSARARLLVVGHRDDVLTRPRWGSTTAHLAQHSACPLLVRRGTAVHDGPVVVAVSARPAGASTLGFAFGEAQLRHRRLVAVHMWTRPLPANGAPPVVPLGGYAVEREQADRELAEALAPWAPRFPGVRVDRLIVHDLELRYTVECASRRGGLLVAGIGRHGHFAELLYGSGGSRPAATRRATCPVLLVPAGFPVPAPAHPRTDFAATPRRDRARGWTGRGG